MISCNRSVVWLSSCLFAITNAFVVPAPTLQTLQIDILKGTSIALSTSSAVETEIESNLALLKRAAVTKKEDSDSVYKALSELEKNMRALAKEDSTVATRMLEALNGDWRLVFTTGTAKTEQQYGRVNYFPLKAVQSFRTMEGSPMKIENGIYFGDFPAIKFQGTMDFDLRKRKLEFDFNKVSLLGFLDISLGQGDAAQLGAKTGLGSQSNVENSSRGKSAFFNWISADEDIATARGGGGGLALWKRVKEE